MKTASLGEKNRLRLPEEVIPAGVERFRVETDERGRIILTPLVEIEWDQRYFWTKRWQEGEREADKDAKAGRVTRYKSARALMKDIG